MTPPQLSDAVPPDSEQVADPTAQLEALLLAQGTITPQQAERARRIIQRLQTPRRLGDVLVEMGQLSRTEYERVLQIHRSRLSVVDILREDGHLDDSAKATYLTAKQKQGSASDRALLVDSGLVTEEQFLKAISVRHGIPYVEPEVGLVDVSLLAKASIPYLIKHRALPIRAGKDNLTAILADPLDSELIGELERIYGLPVQPCCGTAARILHTLESVERFRQGKGEPASGSIEYLEIREVPSNEIGGADAVAILDYILIRAVQLRGSDLHIEPAESRVRVRLRVDGVLQTLTELPANLGPPLVSRVKVLSGCDIADKRRHQDGRISVRLEGREVDCRVSSYVSLHGETLVLRMLDRSRGMVALEDLGFEPKVLSNLKGYVLRASSGMALITGPTGSGKTTTLYSFVDFINHPGIKLITAEDPVEYILDGVTQCPVNAKTGPSFPDSLRAIVRQDPNVVVVGEIRDGITASLAVEAALTGRKVFATFHTEDSVGAAVRLVDMGVEPFLISSTISSVVAQRLVRKVCDGCKAPEEPSREDIRFLGVERSQLIGTMVKGKGCERCGFTGFKGRIGIHEVLQPDDDFRDAIMTRAPSKELRKLARRLPAFLTLQESGLVKAMAGLTTLSEIIANAPRDAGARLPAALREIAGEGRIL